MMSNSQRSISFTVGLLGAILFMMILDPFLPKLLFSTPLLLYPFIYVLLFVFLQNGYKYLLIKKMTPQSSHLLDGQPIQRSIFNHLYYYGILLLLSIRNIQVLDFSTSFIIQFLIAALSVELILWYGSRSLQAEFTQAAVIIKGFDSRMDIPLNTTIYNHPGIYFYSDIQDYALEGNQLTLTLHHHRGRLHFHSSMEMQRQLMGLFQAKGVPAKMK
ncbi:MAG: hypothetical protein K0R93_1287 [Anaerosolibacter sp.]|jgi:hypothetical protein|nr:hypothetical protein [Anaerosolibacter sp.]